MFTIGNSSAMYQDRVYVGSVSRLVTSQQHRKIKYASALLGDGEQLSNVKKTGNSTAIFQDWELFSKVKK